MSVEQEKVWDPKEVSDLLAEINKQDCELPCNIWGLIKQILLKADMNEVEINSLKERVYTLEGLVK